MALDNETLIGVFDDLLKEYQQIKDDNSNKTNEFSLFEFIKSDEVGLSKVLHFLLTYNQNQFAQSFIQKLDLDFECNSETEFYVETTTENGRHDILIQGKDLEGNWSVIIENKLRGAGDQEDQVARYYKDLEKYSGNRHFLLYLPKEKSSPTNYSIDSREWAKKCEQKKGIAWGAKELKAWLESLEFEEKSKISYFINDFKRFLQEEIISMSEKDNSLLNEITSDRSKLELALSIVNIKDKIDDYIKDIIEKRIKDSIDNIKKDANKYKLTFYFVKNSNGFWFGLGGEGEYKIPDYDKFNKNYGYICWKYINYNENKWSLDDKLSFWENNEMSQKIIQEIEDEINSFWGKFKESNRGKLKELNNLS